MAESSFYQSELLGESYTEYRHESGVRIFVFPKQMSTTHALFAVNFGSVDTALDEQGTRPLPHGIAHFLEHKLFFNEDGSDSFERFSDYGADANAYTSHTRTVYLFSCTDRFEESFAELLQFVTHPYFTKESVQKEQGIIGEEIRMCRDNPYDRCYYNMLKGLYAHHPVKIDICGSAASIAAITPEVLYEAYHTYYRPENMALIVCGDVTGEQVLRLADRELAKIENQVGVPRATVKEAPEAALSLVTEEGQVAKPIFAVGMKDTKLPTGERERLSRDAAMAVLNEMLFSQSSPLYTELFEGGHISPGLSFEYALTRDFAFNQVAGEAGDPAFVFARMKQYFEELRKTGLSREDFERCCRIEYAEYIKGFDSTEEIAHNLLSFAFEGVDMFEYVNVLQALTFEEVETLFFEVFAPEGMTLSVVYPQENERRAV